MHNVNAPATPAAHSARRVSSRDIARLAGVSTATVSLVVRGSPLVKEATRERVQAIIDQTGYQSHAAAAALRSSHSNTLGYLVPEIIDPVKDSFRHQVLSALTTRAHPENYHILLDTGMSANHHAALFNSGRIDGALIDWVLDDALLSKLIRRQMPMVLVGRDAGDLPISWVRVDERSGMCQLTRYLLDLGHRDIVVITGGVESNAVVHERLAGFRQAMEAAGIGLTPQTMLWGDFTYETGYMLGQQVLARYPRPTAVLAFNEGIAVGLLKVARSLGVRVPQDLAIATVDDSPWVHYISPELTSVHIPMYAAGLQAAEMLLAQIADPTTAIQQVTLAPTLFVRESTGPLMTK